MYDVYVHIYWSITPSIPLRYSIQQRPDRQFIVSRELYIHGNCHCHRRPSSFVDKQYVVVTVCVKAGLEHIAWTWLSHLAIWGSVLTWFIYFIIYSHLFQMLGISASMSLMVGIANIALATWLPLTLSPSSQLVPSRVQQRLLLARSYPHSVRRSHPRYRLESVTTSLTITPPLTAFSVLAG